MRWKILLVIGGTLLVMIAIISLASRAILLDSYEDLEQRYIERDVQRVKAAITKQLDALGATTADYATWDEMYDFARRPGPAFAKSNFSDAAAANLRLSVVIVADPQGAPVYLQTYGTKEERGRLSTGISRWLDARPHMALLKGNDEKAQGIVALPEGTLLMASRPITDDEGVEPVDGTLILARILGSAEVAALAERQQVSLALFPLGGATLPDEAAKAAARITPAEPTAIDTSRTDTVSAYAVLQDVNGSPAALVRVESPRDIRQQGARTTRYFFYWLLFIGAGFGAAVLLTIERTVLSRLLRLGASVLAIGTGDNPYRRVAIKGKDQIAYLAAAINGMLDALGRSTEELRASERRNAAFLDAVPDVIFRVTRDGTILDARSPGKHPLIEAAENLVGRDSEQVLPFFSFISPEHFDRSITATAAALDTGSPQMLEFHVEVEGGRRWFEQRFVPGGENEVIVLVRDVTALKQAEEARRKEVLLKEIHHRVKNNLQVISSLLALQAGITADPKTRALLTESRDRVRSMALIHEKLYQTGDERGISFAAYVRDLAAHLRHSYAGNSEAVAIGIDVQEMSLDMDLSVPCGLIITELLSNALRHAFPGDRRGTVAVRLRRAADGALALTVSDDGVGFPAEVDYRAPATLGLRIVHMLVEQLRGAITMGEGPGASFTITFPAG